MHNPPYIYIIWIYAFVLGIKFTVDSDLNGGSPKFTLTCISTGGPVTWTRDNVGVTEGTKTVLQHIHTLTVTGKQSGLYKCTVNNNTTALTLDLKGMLSVIVYRYIIEGVEASHWEFFNDLALPLHIYTFTGMVINKLVITDIRSCAGLHITC